MTETVIEIAIAEIFVIVTVTIIAVLIATMTAVLIVMMTAALIAMTDGVIGTIAVTNGRCIGTVTAGVTNLVW